MNEDLDKMIEEIDQKIKEMEENCAMNERVEECENEGIFPSDNGIDEKE